MTSKVEHDDRNDHIVYNFFHCYATKSSLVEARGEQISQLFEKNGSPVMIQKSMVLGLETTSNTTAVMVVVINLPRL